MSEMESSAERTPSRSEPRRATSAEGVATCVRESARVLPVGRRTKPSLSGAPSDVTLIDMAELRGIVEYAPGEYTVTARAGTPLAQIEEALAEHGQFLPFEPPLSRAGATLGGAIASGLSGSLQHRYGGPRDFVLGVRFVDGEGRIARGGGRVVKNAAGFDFPKLFVGSAGRLGVLIEATLKVFPRPPAFATRRFELAGTEEALEALVALGASPLDLAALDFEPPQSIVVRVGGEADGMNAHVARVERALARAGDRPHDDEAFWARVSELEWADGGGALVKLSTTPRRIVELDAELGNAGVVRRYTAGGHVAWTSWPRDATRDDVESLLRRVDARGLVVRGLEGPPLLPPRPNGFADRVRTALDPRRKFLELE